MNVLGMLFKRQPNGKVRATSLGFVLSFLVLIIVMNFAADFITRFTMPARHAMISGCTGEMSPGADWPNQCDEPINFRYCLILPYNEDGSRPENFCRTTRLEPGQAVTTLSADFAALREAGQKWQSIMTWACKPPFTPAMVSTQQSTLRKERGCKREDPTDAQD